MVESTEKDREVETRNLTQGIHVLLFIYLFIYLVVDLDGLIENAQLRQHYATSEPKIEQDFFFCVFMERNYEMEKNLQM